jgi:hypothetical protein
MVMKTYSGSCHCRAVRFEADIDFAEGSTRCNCSVCTKARAWFVVIPPERARLLTGADALTEYHWAPPGKQPFLHYQFCKTCGIRSFGTGSDPESGKRFCFVNVAALDDATPDEVAEAVRYVDGRHDKYDQAPKDTRVL